MKKLTLVALAVFSFIVANAQMQTSSSITIGSSYVTIGLVDVHPYLSGNNGDGNFNFKLNIGTKFKINDVLSEPGGAVTGYVIKMWNFTTDTTKEKFYQNLLKTVAEKNREKFSKDSINSVIAAKKAELKAIQAEVTKDSIAKAEKKQTYDKTRKQAQSQQHNAFSSAVNINVNKSLTKSVKKDPGLKKQVNKFNAVQSSVKTNLKNGLQPDSTAKENFIKAAQKLPSTNASFLKKYMNTALIYQNNLQKADNDYRVSLSQFEQNSNNLTALKKQLEQVNHRINSSNKQPSGNAIDPNAYKATKSSKNYPLDTSSDTTDKASKFKELAYLDSWANGWLFFISAKDFSKYTVLVYPKSDKFSWGFLTLPVKMRFDNLKGGRFDFEQNLNFGLTFGDKHQFPSTSDISLNSLAGLAVVNVPLNNATTTNAATSTTAISMSIGEMIQFDKFQLGVFWGFDFAGAHANQFAYQGKRWIGFAIGVSLFGESKTTATTQTQDSGKAQ